MEMRWQTMSDYIRKSALIDFMIRNVVTLTEEAHDFKVEMIDAIKNQPTISETEIIRKPFERVLQRLEECKKTHEKRLLSTKLKPHEKIRELRLEGCYINAIEIVKEECGINE
jgi:hypothetical protein